MYVIRKRFYKDRLISLFLQLSGRQEILIIGAYVPPSSRLNNGDLNAEFNCYLKNISDPSISSPTHSLFRYLHSHQFEDLCAFDSSSSPLPTFRHF
uniref:Uncharacterized protein n=1 Tax=Rhizophagus irregularis (strain DAOM 181602 / DAOM 197198 / MUCL 43194) TaxID=747089 RepID=U9SPM8_RHIID